MMAMYYGIVKDNRIILDEGVELPDGLRVEVHLERSSDSVMSEGEEAREALLKERLRASGLLGQDPHTGPMPGEDDRHPVRVEGQPLSEMIIAERR